MADFMSRKNLAMASVGVGLAGVLVAFTFNGNIILQLIGIAMAAAGSAVSALVTVFGNQGIKLLTGFKQTITLTESGYEIPPSFDVVVRKKGDFYYASRFIGLKIYESSLEKDEGAIMAYNKQFEKAIINFKKPVKIGYVMYAMDISKKRKELEAKKSQALYRLQKEKENPNPDFLRIERLEREVAYWNNQIAKLSAGLRPMAILMYAQTTNFGTTKDEAIARVKTDASELATLLENSLNAETYVLEGSELLKAIEFEHTLPVSEDEVESEYGIELKKTE
ncbi:MAG: hypothetical protein GXN92_03330 [Candidatus Micrarchaeota archaeon]|nr:hypothetical protein [Candidatus Micrarchaeota archaeon]